MTDAPEQVGLFDVPELSPLPNPGRAEAGVMFALQAAARDKLIREVDGGMVSGVLIAARALDEAETIRSAKDRAYAVTALLPPFQRLLHGLGLPLETGPVGEARVPDPSPAAGAGDWLSEQLGPS